MRGVYTSSIEVERGSCADPETYRRAEELLRRLLGDSLDIPQRHRIEYESFPDCEFPPRATVWTDVSSLVGLEEELWFPALRISLFFDRRGRPVAHLYKQFKLYWYGTEHVFAQCIVDAVREYLSERADVSAAKGLITNTPGYICLDKWLRGDEVLELRKWTRTLVLTVLYVVQRCPEQVAIWLDMETRFRLSLLEREEPTFVMWEPDVDILHEVDLDKLGESAKQLLKVFEK